MTLLTGKRGDGEEKESQELIWPLWPGLVPAFNSHVSISSFKQIPSDLPFIYSHQVSICTVQEEQSTGELFSVEADKAASKTEVNKKYA